MKTTTTLALALMTASAVAGPATETPPVEPAKSGSVLDSIHLFGDARLRYEYADFNSPAFDRANLLSIRARLGVKTDSIYGFKFLAEADGTGALSNRDIYNPYPGKANYNGRAVIADPNTFLLNRLQLAYTAEPIDTTVTVGRQYIKFDDQRFIGSVGWRQNDQTFDAAVLENSSIDHLSFTYAYFNQVNRIFGSQAPTEGLQYWEGNNHLIHLEYDGIDAVTLRGFAYLLDFDEALTSSTNTYGLEVEGDYEMSVDNKLNYLATLSTQTDAGDNFRDYQEYYVRGRVGMENDCYNYGLGVECMTSEGQGEGEVADEVGRFIFPLGTNHKFNGFADAFLTTPPNGLLDYYGWVGTKYFGFKHTASLHYFRTQHDSTELGWEIDYVAARKIGEYTKVVIKGAYLDGKGAQIDVARASAEINVSF
jgi:hypothetical protein